LRLVRKQLEPRPDDWVPAGPRDKWIGRKDGNYAWYEIQDTVDYWGEFQKQKIVYQVIQYSPSYATDLEGLFSNDKTFIIPSTRRELIAVLNSPLMWWFNWRHLKHLKDEALSPMGYKMEQAPVSNFASKNIIEVAGHVDSLLKHSRYLVAAFGSIHDWLRLEFGLEKAADALSKPHDLDADGFAAAVRKALPKSRKLSSAEIARLKQEHASTVEPARRAAREALALERRLSDLVNAAYGLTPDEVALMWKTAPPRMPILPPET